MKKLICIFVAFFLSGAVFAEPGMEEINERFQTLAKRQVEYRNQAEQLYADRLNDSASVLTDLETIKKEMANIDAEASRLEFEKNRIARGFGCVSGRCIDGRGKYVSENGSSYEGEFVGEKRQGQGSYTRTDGNILTGNWSENRLEGDCRMTPQGKSAQTGKCSQEGGKVVFVPETVTFEQSAFSKSVLLNASSLEKTWWELHGNSVHIGIGLLLVLWIIFWKREALIDRLDNVRSSLRRRAQSNRGESSRSSQNAGNQAGSSVPVAPVTPVVPRVPGAVPPAPSQSPLRTPLQPPQPQPPALVNSGNATEVSTSSLSSLSRSNTTRDQTSQATLSSGATPGDRVSPQPIRPNASTALPSRTSQGGAQTPSQPSAATQLTADELLRLAMQVALEKQGGPNGSRTQGPASVRRIPSRSRRIQSTETPSSIGVMAVPTYHHSRAAERLNHLDTTQVMEGQLDGRIPWEER